MSRVKKRGNEPADSTIYIDLKKLDWATQQKILVKILQKKG